MANASAIGQIEVLLARSSSMLVGSGRDVGRGISCIDAAHGIEIVGVGILAGGALAEAARASRGLAAMIWGAAAVSPAVISTRDMRAERGGCIDGQIAGSWSRYFWSKCPANGASVVKGTSTGAR